MTPLLEMRSVSKQFGGLSAVTDLDIHVDEGECLGLIGPNGAGKTTAFSILMGELEPSSGSVHFRGGDITGLPTHRRVQLGIARTYQIPRPFGDMSVLDNVRVGAMPDSVMRLLIPDRATESEWNFLQTVGFTAREASMLPGQLSMGELRKLELARNLATGPRIMLLDEVFAGLTVAEIGQLTELLLQRKRDGMTYMVVSHDLKSLRPLVDRVVAISFGSAIAQGSFDAVLENPQVREAYLGQD
ncbi:MAG: ABC transporter ATP-binding protein [Rhodobacteraceae bacterium]|nr:ABC transporter ATP-binding protein [Paracoccaceae bacterium]